MRAFYIKILLISIALVSTTFARDAFYNWGVSGDLENYGGGFSVFLQAMPETKLKFDIETSWTMVQDGTGIYAYNYYTEQYVLMNPQNLSFAKIVGDVSFFPWTQSMHESFNIGFFLGAGPIWSLNTEEDEGFIKRWKAVESNQSFYERGGVQASIKGSAFGSYRIRLGYDEVNFNKIVDHRSKYNGLFLQFGMEFLF